MIKRISAIFLTLVLVLSLTITTVFAVERYEVLMIGDKDKYVTELQEALYSKKYLSVKPTGYFGTDTQNAVIAFQKAKDLTVDGKAGPQVRKALLGSSYSEIPSARFTSGTNSTADVTALRLGDKGSAVEKAQTRLKELGYYTYASITGYFGPVTKEALVKFQRTNDLTADGILGAKTSSLLYASSAKKYVMSYGDSGDDIQTMQQRLKTLGYLKASATGYFGSSTLAAVKSFQKRNSLSVDGKVGVATRNKLFSSSAVKASDSSSSDSDPDSNSNSTGVDLFLEVANKQLGKKYVYGEEGPTTFDCSGFVYYCLKNAGVKTSRLSAAGYSNVTSWASVSSKQNLKRGDLIFFNSSSSTAISHVAIYMGNGMIIHAIPSAGEVSTSALTGYWDKYYASARRPFSSSSSETDPTGDEETIELSEAKASSEDAA